METHRPRYAVHAALIVICLVLACPALYALQVSTLTLEEAFTVPPKLFPPSTDFYGNVSSLFTDQNFGQLMLNTLNVSMLVVVVKTLFAMLAGLAFVYFDFPGKWLLFFFILLTLLMPTELILMPLSGLVSQLEWVKQDPDLALTIPFLASAVGTFLFRQHFSNIPRELVEAAQLDGAGPLRFLFLVLLPLSWNVIGAHAVIQFISMWHQYAWPVFIGLRPEDQMIQVGVRKAVIVGTQTDFGLLMAAGVVASIPPLVFFVLLQKQFMSGFALMRDK
ncbi:MAG TPA: carbohydrate ABC transporter permease [Aggregatilinea sp.]|uniref:carbohydrate ABC transporter permease n=1 Tax=Aggregatilinea sp. TaxID=2806333 RepID=UPI002CDB44D6|nr:carbohydrate ABC transporter permease [Aggregatilinea sp.]HML20341.1 carbohydrate ABC transporter permease [Aggregatilinea sp.]